MQGNSNISQPQRRLLATFLLICGSSIGMTCQILVTLFMSSLCRFCLWGAFQVLQPAVSKYPFLPVLLQPWQGNAGHENTWELFSGPKKCSVVQMFTAKSRAGIGWNVLGWASSLLHVTRSEKPLSRQVVVPRVVGSLPSSPGNTAWLCQVMLREYSIYPQLDDNCNEHLCPAALCVSTSCLYMFLQYNINAAANQCFQTSTGFTSSSAFRLQLSLQKSQKIIKTCFSHLSRTHCGKEK